MRLSLNDLTVQRLHSDTQTRVHDTQLRGFGILVSRTTKTWFVITGKERRTRKKKGKKRTVYILLVIEGYRE